MASPPSPQLANRERAILPEITRRADHERAEHLGRACDKGPTFVLPAFRLGHRVGWLLVSFVALAGCEREAMQPTSVELARSYLWPATDSAFRTTERALFAARATSGVDRSASEELRRVLRRGPPLDPGAPASLGDSLNALAVEAPGGRTIPTLVRLPQSYAPDRQWPLLLAMHGGPPSSEDGAAQGASRMVQVWAGPAEEAGWIVASPAMVDVVSREGQTEDRLPYEIFQPEEARAVIAAVRARFSVDPDRIVSTGISLGSNFSIAYGAAYPDLFSAVVPVSTEGESREHLLRNLAPVPTYVLNGARDRNIRGVSGPRAMDEILTAFRSDLVYEEFSDRAHEGFSERYPDVLDWLETRPRQLHPRSVTRVPHKGIIGTNRRVHWMESGTRQGLVRARARSTTEIDVTARWTDVVTLHLNDRIVDLDQPITVRVNGVTVFAATIERSIVVALEGARRLGDERRLYPARLTVAVPKTPESIATAAAFWDELTPSHREGALSFWEMYAVRALEERFPDVGFEGNEVRWAQASAPEQVALQVTEVVSGSPADDAGLRIGDVLIRFGGEPFFAGRSGVDRLHHWLVRELRTQPQDYDLAVWRENEQVTLTASYGLGPYRPPGGAE